MCESIEQWLAQLGLEKYAPIFASQEIDQAILSELTDGDLEKLSIPLGPRKKILKAIAARPPAAGMPTTTPPDDRSAAATRPSAEAERRQLTVMFCDLVGSTALAQKLELEDMRDVILAYQAACRAAIGRYEGFVAKYMGDGVLAYFGYPQAHEDEAERAIHAGLALIEAMQQLDASIGAEMDVELMARIGIATGPVVVGDLIGKGASQESAVIGETPNLATRLQALAAPNTVVVAAGTHDLAIGRFEYEDLGAHQVKGIVASVRAWRVLAPTAAESRFEQRHRTALTPLTGREHEIGLLLERWEQAKAGDGQVVLLSGEPGIGKSRIIEALRERTAAEEPLRLRYQCSPYHTNSSLHPVIQQLERAAGFEDHDSTATRLDKLESWLAPAMPECERGLPALTALLSLPGHERPWWRETSPEQQKEEVLEALEAQLEGFSRHRAVMLFFEDAHWADPTSLELLELLVGRMHRMQVLALITFRPEFTPPWSGHAHVTSVTLNRFSRRLVAAMLDRITGEKPLPAAVRDQIIEKTDGVPLFVEELTKTILESGLLKEEVDGYTLAGRLDEVAIPATLYDSLMARLDRLNAVKEVAQLAAVIGREFPYDLLAAVSPLGGLELDLALERLVNAELVFGSRRGSYIFKHALLQDAAYESLLKSRRQELHGRIATVMAERFPEIAARQPELLAHHYSEANRPREAVTYWQQAGERASHNSAYAEAVSHLSRGLAQLVALPDGPERARQELALQTAFAAALLPTTGYGSPEVAQAYDRAKALCERLGDTEHLFPVLCGQWASGLHRQNQQNVLRLAQETLRHARQSADSGVILMAERTVGHSLTLTGRFREAARHLEFVRQSYDRERHSNLVSHYGLDLLAPALSYLTLVEWLLGHPGKAAETSRAALAHAEAVARGNTMAHTLVHAGTMFAQFQSNAALVQAHARALARLSTEGSFPMYLAWCDVMAGWSAFELGEREQGLSLMLTGIRDATASGSVLYQPYFLTLLAQSYGRLDQVEDGLGAIDRAIEFVEAREETWYAAEVFRVKASLLLREEAGEAVAERWLHKSIAIAQEQEARSLELRGVLSLARLWQKHRKRKQAFDLLTSVYDGFPQDFQTDDLTDARTMMEILR